MKYRILKVSIVAFMLLSSLWVKTPARAAATTADFSISPFLQTVKIDSSEATKSFSVDISNNTKTEHVFSISVLDFGTLDETGGLVFAGANSGNLVKKYGLSSWLQIDSSSLSIEPGKIGKVTASIANDSTLTPGGHYAAIVATVDSTNTAAVNGVNLKQKLSSLVFATKAGGETYDLHLLEVSHASSWHSLPNQVTLRFKNAGNVHVIPRGFVELKNANGQVVSRGIINNDSSNVLPESIRKLTVNLRPIKKGITWPGTYHVQVTYRYDGYEKYASRSFTLRYMPWSFALILVAIIAVSIAIIYKHKNRAKKTK